MAQVFAELLRIARRHTRRADEVDDLVQEALLEAVRSGRDDLRDGATLRWLGGVIRNKAKLAARTAARRRRREGHWHETSPAESGTRVQSDLPAVLDQLPPSLKLVAALALSGHSRREIAYLLGLPDTALRQRLRMLKQRLRAAGIGMPESTPGLPLDLPYGRIRDALLPALLRNRGIFASHDPDGHLFVVRRSQPARPRQQGDGSAKEDKP